MSNQGDSDIPTNPSASPSTAADGPANGPAIADASKPAQPAALPQAEVVVLAERTEQVLLSCVLAFVFLLGGVGKTTTAINLGTARAASGERVLVIDLDPQGNASTGLGIDRRNRRVSTYDVLAGDAP